MINLKSVKLESLESSKRLGNHTVFNLKYYSYISKNRADSRVQRFVLQKVHKKGPVRVEEEAKPGHHAQQ